MEYVTPRTREWFDRRYGKTQFAVICAAKVRTKRFRNRPPFLLVAQDDADSAAARWRLVADQLKPKAPKLAALMDEAQHDVLAYMSFPREHRQKLHSTNPLERLNGEIKRRTNVVGIFPNEDAITRLVSAILLEQNDEWAVSRRYMTLESIAQTSDNLTLKLPTVAA